MRVWKIGKMRWYSVAVGENVKEEGAESYMDAFSRGYGSKLEKSLRMLRTELDWLKLYHVQKSNFIKIVEENTVDLGLSERQQWFSGGSKRNLRTGMIGVLRKEWIILSR